MQATPEWRELFLLRRGCWWGFFLPGDSLLFTAGLACNPNSKLFELVPLDLLTLNAYLIPAAVIGDTVGYWIGYRAGIGMYNREKTFFFRKDHLMKTKEFYEKHGGYTIVVARFVPLLRTFAPVVAGIAQMPYRQFIAYNVFGGIGWVTGLSVLGYYLGNVPWISKNLEASIMVVIFISILPVIISVLKSWFKRGDTAPTPGHENRAEGSGANDVR